MINKTIQQLQNELDTYQATTPQQLQTFKKTFLTNKGTLANLFRQLKTLSSEQKTHTGILLNQLKQQAKHKYTQLQKQLTTTPSSPQQHQDITLPPAPQYLGAHHPITHTTQKILRIFQDIGFSITDGPEIDNDENNFQTLGIHENHPARQSQDTFFIQNPTKHKTLLRTHTSSVQAHTLKNIPPPIRVVATGKVFRRETISARSHCMFHQLEAVYVNKNVNFLDLKETILFFIHQFFGPKIKVRLRPSYFPFTEPSVEIDVQCLLCQGKGCTVCKHTGWVEVAGAGMIDPQVLINCNIDTNIYSGFAIGIGIERLIMLHYQIPDIRLFTQNDARFLRQFASEG